MSLSEAFIDGYVIEQCLCSRQELDEVGREIGFGSGVDSGIRFESGILVRGVLRATAMVACSSGVRVILRSLGGA